MIGATQYAILSGTASSIHTVPQMSVRRHTFSKRKTISSNVGNFAHDSTVAMWDIAHCHTAQVQARYHPRIGK